MIGRKLLLHLYHMLPTILWAKTQIFHHVILGTREYERMNRPMKAAYYSRGEWPSGLYSLRQVTEVKLF